MIPNMQAYNDLKDMVRFASVQMSVNDPVAPNAEKLWDNVQQLVTGVKTTLDLDSDLTPEQEQYNCTLDQIQADLAVELGVGADVPA